MDERQRHEDIVHLLKQTAAAQPLGAQFTPRRKARISEQVLMTIIPHFAGYGFTNQDEAFAYIKRLLCGLLGPNCLERESIHFRQVLHYFPNSVISIDGIRSRGREILLNYIHAAADQNLASDAIVDHFITDDINIDNERRYWFVSVREERVVPRDRAIVFVEVFLRGLVRTRR